jgi:hypothetical protein
MEIKNIESEKWYSNNSILKMGIPFMRTNYIIKKWINEGWLTANSTGLNKGKRYYVKGEDLIEFLGRWEKGEFKEKKKGGVLKK